MPPKQKQNIDEIALVDAPGFGDLPGPDITKGKFTALKATDDRTKYTTLFNAARKGSIAGVSTTVVKEDMSWVGEHQDQIQEYIMKNYTM
jgi:hypothetical protein